MRDRLRVLLVSGEPHAGERTWRNLLKADPSVDLVHFTILRPPEKQDGTPIRELSLIAFPIRELFEIKLDEFDLIIFDRYRRRGVLPQMYLENIAEYVQKGGALLEASGQGYATPLSLFRTPLGQVMPAEPTGQAIDRPFKPTVTEVGRRHPVTAGLPGDRPDGEPSWGRWFHQVEVVPGNGAVVMNGADDRPLLILDRVGKGRVAQLASDQMWLWSRGFEGGGPQAELLRRLAHWLMKEPDWRRTICAPMWTATASRWSAVPWSPTRAASP
ncbi:glutamine amidotransferase [Azospirillum brasilense]|uniref:glutamine amidotransferase n=1 Tax=Azospirillum brasilense TaxID=192 RepID=UPI001FECCCCF|nr:glutamine amidotransferase [Azospirillum brasilense]